VRGLFAQTGRFSRPEGLLVDTTDKIAEEIRISGG
jgi:hypothetical protein